jgi:diacylglycerol kinase family enzyme
VRATLIVNPCSHRVTDERLHAVKQELHRTFPELRVVLSERRGHATELARAAAGDAVFAYGGDGLVNEVVNGADGSIPVGFLAGGHTNVLPRVLGLPRDPVAAAARIAAGRTRRISLGRVNGRRFAFSAGIGVGAEAVRRVDALGRTPDGRRPGDLTFARIVAGRLLRGHEPELDIVGFGRAAMAFVSNGSIFSCAGRVPVRLSPDARFELGLDFAAPARVTVGALVRLLPRLALGRGLSGASGVLSGHDLDRIEVRADSPRPLQADGEDLGDVEEAVFEAERDAVSVFVP